MTTKHTPLDATPTATNTNPPTLRYLESLRSEMETEFAAEDQRIGHTRDVRDLVNRVLLPDNFRLVDVEVRDPTLADEIQRVSATLSINPAHLTVTPARPSDKAQENATMREHFTEEVLRVSGKRRPGMETLPAAVDSICGDGVAWTKFTFSRDVWDNRYSLKRKDFKSDPMTDGDGNPIATAKSGGKKFDQATEDAKRAAGPPFTWTCCDARTLYPVYQGGKVGEVLEVTRRPLHQTFRQYRLAQDKRGNIVSEELGQPISPRGSHGAAVAMSTTVEVLEHWDQKWASVVVLGRNFKGEPTSAVARRPDDPSLPMQWEHGYGEVPYFPAFGHMRSYWQNKKSGWGVGQSKVWLVEYRAFLVTLLANVCARDAMPPIINELPADAAGLTGETGEPKAREIWDPRTIITTRPGAKYVPMAFPPVAQSLIEQIKIVDQWIEKLETPRTMNEIGSGMEGAGFAINQVLAESRIRHSPLQHSIESMLEAVTRFMWKLIRTKVGETVWVYSADQKSSGFVGAGPDDLTDDVVIKWELDPETPSAKVIESRYYAERVQGGTLSLDQAIEKMGDSPDEVRLGRAMDRLRASPWYMAYQDKAVLQSVGKGGLLEEAAQAAQVAQTGQLPISGPPLAPPGMVPGAVPDIGAAALGAPGQGQPGAAPPATNAPTMGTSPGFVLPQQSATPGAAGITGR